MTFERDRRKNNPIIVDIQWHQTSRWILMRCKHIYDCDNSFQSSSWLIFQISVTLLFPYSKHSRHWTKSLPSYLTSWMQFLFLFLLLRNFETKLRDGFHVNVGLVLWLFKLYASEYLKVLVLFLKRTFLSCHSM